MRLALVSAALPVTHCWAALADLAVCLRIRNATSVPEIRKADAINCDVI
jgi:hypothetical protein